MQNDQPKALQGERILFCEDEFKEVEIPMKIIEERYGAECIFRDSLESAFDFVRQDQNWLCACIDLHFHGRRGTVPAELKAKAEQQNFFYFNGTNQGQYLGMYLSFLKPPKPYVYYTGYRSKLENENGTTPPSIAKLDNLNQLFQFLLKPKKG